MTLTNGFGMENLIPIVNKIQDVCASAGTFVDVDLPQIAVIGPQSAGKSSVLENFVRRDFLPRGTGMVTRCPLVLHLIREPTNSEEYGQFVHKGNEKFTDFDKIRQEIDVHTKELTNGSKMGISDLPITLSIHSPNVLDLTLIDLPGITKIPVGDQPENIENIVKDMILKYISKKNCLILAVSAANSDLANSDALKLAREVDKDGSRTIGVITKLDLMDKGTDARDILEGKLLPLCRGYVGVINRSQKDITSKKGIEDALKFERDWIMANYKNIADRLGTPYLEKKLNEELKKHIYKTLPTLKSILRKQIASLQQDVEKYEELHPQDPVLLTNLIFNKIQQLQKDFEEEIGSCSSFAINIDKLSCGAKIKHIFHDTLPKEILSVSYNEEELKEKINSGIQRFYGISVGLKEPPFKAFEALVRDQISQLKQPILRSIDLVVDELLDAVNICTQELQVYPLLHDNVKNHILTFISSNSVTFQKNVLSLIEMELAYMNAAHPEFIINRSSPQSSNSNHSKLNGVTHQGTVKIEMMNGDAVPYRIKLTSTTLTCTRAIPDKIMDDELRPTIHLPLDGVKLNKRIEEELKWIIVLSRLDGRPVFEHYDELKLIFQTTDDFNLWKTFLLSATNGCDPPKQLHPNESVINLTFEYCRSYMNIVRNTLYDMVPKAITLYVMRQLEGFIRNDLAGKILPDSQGEYSKLLEMDSKEVVKYESNKKMYEACKKALDQMVI